MQTRDEEEIDALIRRFFGAFDNRNERVPEEDALIAMFADKAVIARHADRECELFTAAEFARPRMKLLRSGELSDFHEWEESSSTRIVGDIAARFSRYSKSGQLRGEIVRSSGTKFFQLARIAERWRIVSVMWTDDIAADSATA